MQRLEIHELPETQEEAQAILDELKHKLGMNDFTAFAVLESFEQVCLDEAWVNRVTMGALKGGSILSLELVDVPTILSAYAFLQHVRKREDKQHLLIRYSTNPGSTMSPVEAGVLSLALDLPLDQSLLSKP